jgi:hypothetical protein
MRCCSGRASRSDAIVRSEPEVVDFLGDHRRRRAEGSCGRGVATRLAPQPHAQLCPTRTYLLLILVLQLYLLLILVLHLYMLLILV